MTGTRVNAMPDRDRTSTQAQSRVPAAHHGPHRARSESSKRGELLMWSKDMLRGYRDALTLDFVPSEQKWDSESEDWKAGYHEGMKFYMPH